MIYKQESAGIWSHYLDDYDAKNISIGSNDGVTDEIWKVSRYESKIYRHDTSTWELKKDDMIANALTVGPNITYIVNSSNEIYKYQGSAWT